MSYILDALKKSEQERGHGNIPDVQTVHSSGLSYRNEKKAYWPYVLIAAILLNLVAIIYFIVNKESAIDMEATAQQTNITAHIKTENNVLPDSLEQLDKSAVEISDTKKTKIKEPVVETVAVKKIQATDKNKAVNADIGKNTNIIEFYDLPESIQQELPAIIISAHIYSTNPVQRSIVINNNFMEEGEYVLDGLILYEITPDGAIFNYQGTLFNYGVVSGWQ